MAIQLQTVRANVRARLREPTNNRFFTNVELDMWINDAMREIAHELKFEKRILSFLGSTYDNNLGTTPRYFKLPNDFLSVDAEDGIMFDGIRRLPTSGREVDQMQEKAVGSLPVNVNLTLTVDDYFTLSFSGAIMHYATQSTIRKVINESGVTKYDADLTGTNNGYLAWFVPNPLDTTVIRLSYNALPTALSADTDYAYIMSTFDELLVYGGCERGAEKLVAAGRHSLELPSYYRQKFEMRLAKARISMRPPEKRNKCMTARQAYGMYSSNQVKNNSISTGSE